MKKFYVYILASQRNGTLYIGVTNNILTRTYKHKTSFGSLFTKKYNVNKLVYVEEFLSVHSAIAREKQLKHWNREWKINLIDSMNPKWTDLFETEMDSRSSRE